MLTTTRKTSDIPLQAVPVDMAARQKPLQMHYLKAPADAWITDRASTSARRIQASYPLYGEVTLDGGRPTPVQFGVHRAVGGDSDLPVPGELLSAALASCLDSTIRILANRLRIELVALEVEVAARVDVRGTLLVDGTVPVGFQKIDVELRLEAAGEVEPKAIDRLLMAAEHSCVVLQTLRNGPKIAIRRQVR